MKRNLMLACLLLAPALAQAADNWNQCVRESNGLGGFQFKNVCQQDVAVFVRNTHGQWGTFTLQPGYSETITSYSRVVACPLQDNGKSVSFDQAHLRCVVDDGS